MTLQKTFADLKMTSSSPQTEWVHYWVEEDPDESCQRTHRGSSHSDNWMCQVVSDERHEDDDWVGQC